MNNDYIYRSFTKAELVQRCIDLGINRVAMLAERSRLRAELEHAREERDSWRGGCDWRDAEITRGSVWMRGLYCRR